MKKTLTLLAFFSLLFISCNNEKQTINLTTKQSRQLDHIKDTYSAEYIRLGKVQELNSNKSIQNSISIDIFNSSSLSINDTGLKKHCDHILTEFIKSYQPESIYDAIEIRFSEEKDIFFFNNLNSKGFTYSKDIIDDIMSQLNSSKYLLEQAYFEYNKKGDFDSLIIYANNLLKENPSFNLAIKYRAIAYYRLNQLDKAEKDFVLARSIDNSDIDNPMNLAIIYGDIGQYKIGLAYVDTVLKMQTNYPKAFYYKGIYNFKLGDKRNSLSYLKRAEELGVSEATAFIKLEFNE
jgi:tetratricopeptide (TPR) repeat protein